MNIGVFYSREKPGLSVFVLPLVLAGCSGSSLNNGLSPTAVSNLDWTGQACESPALRNVLGSYVGELRFSDDSARSCRWNAEIVINGVSEPNNEICSLSGSVTTTLIEQGTQIDVPYICAEMSQPTGFASGLMEGLSLNTATTNSVILQLDEPTTAFDSNGLPQINAVTQFESLTVGGGSLISANGTIRRQK